MEVRRVPGKPRKVSFLRRKSCPRWDWAEEQSGKREITSDGQNEPAINSLCTERGVREESWLDTQEVGWPRPSRRSFTQKHSVLFPLQTTRNPVAQSSLASPGCLWTSIPPSATVIKIQAPELLYFTLLNSPGTAMISW